MTVFRQADARYNSGLFHFVEERGRSSEVDRLSAALQIDDRTLRDIIGGLYYPESPYEFSVLPADILGQVYERFLGKVIRLTDAHRAVVELKPEVRRAGGVYYTPTHIVEHIVRASLAPMLAEKVPTPARPTSAQSADIKVLDPACGSGSFLLGAYQYLLNWHRDWYTRDGGEKWAKRRNPTVFLWNTGEWRLTTAERKRILISCIFGVDIDAQAVEVTKLSLLLKVLEGETQQAIQTNLRLFHERALPDLDSNIKRGNSLIENDFYVSAQGNLLDDSDMVHAFDWRSEFRATMRAGGFHAVIGNPPYDVLEKERGAASWPHAALAEYVGTIDKYSPALGGKLNLFRFFLIRGLSLTRPTGRFGMIVPLALLADISCARARQHLMLSTNGLVANCFPQKDNANRRIFRDAKLSTVVLTGERIDVQRQDASVNVRVFPWNSFSDQPRESQVRLVDTEVIDPINTPVPLVSADEWELLRMLYSRRGVTRLGEVKDFSITRGEINQTVYRAYITSNPEHARLLKGVEIARYALRERLSQGAREWFDERRYLRDYKPKAIVQAQRIATQRITGVDEQLRIVATLIDAPTYFADSTNSVPHFSLPARVPARSTEFEALSVAVQAYEHKQQRWYE
ncbi:MAG: HsdM family class I SAM-dependent methyltransferase [Gemmatimonadaceae bacterium]